MSVDHVAKVKVFLPSIHATNPSSAKAGTTPDSFSAAPQLAVGRLGALTYSSLTKLNSI
ncbi:hypothetical protein CA54_60860 [Symmachiella macrocystis]|uniref:Uncharacterized protein n=1 Tax=Symmachiella macrocystis TaxID=2527985 RepID=A0A5C6B1B0_9PLAN|nr:hypothetical protein CA54_60860 [Symmachiella macrocystis]